MADIKVKLEAFDVIIVGAGGAGLSAAVQTGLAKLKTAVITKVYPTRSHTVSAQGGIAASLGNMQEDRWIWHMYDTVKGSDYLGDQDAIEEYIKHAPEAIYELEHLGVPFTRNENGTIYQRAFGGHSQNFGAGTMKRACAIADRSGHSLLYALFGRTLKSDVCQYINYYTEYYTLELFREKETGKAIGVLAWDMVNGGFTMFFGQAVILATGGNTRNFRTSTNAMINTGDGWKLCLKAGLPIEDPEFVQFHPTGIYGIGNLISESVRGEGGYLLNALGERFMSKYAPKAMDLASRDVVSRAESLEVRAGHGVGPKKDHVLLKLDHLGKDLIMSKLPALWELAYKFVGVDCTKEPIPVQPTAHFHMGGIPTNIKSEVVDWDGKNEVRIPGLYAGGECACQSVHGANRLAGNSLLDIVINGKQAGMNAARYILEERPEFPLPPLENIADEYGKDTIEKVKAYFDGGPGEVKMDDILEKLRDSMQHNMSVFRIEKDMKEQSKEIDKYFEEFKKVGMTDKSPYFNTELIELLELESLLYVSKVETEAALARQESRGAHFRDDYPERDDINWHKHTLVRWKDGKVELDYKPVRMKGATAPTFPPKKRVY